MTGTRDSGTRHITVKPMPIFLLPTAIIFLVIFSLILALNLNRHPMNAEVRGELNE